MNITAKFDFFFIIPSPLLVIETKQDETRDLSCIKSMKGETLQIISSEETIENKKRLNHN